MPDRNAGMLNTSANPARHTSDAKNNALTAGAKISIKKSPSLVLLQGVGIAFLRNEKSEPSDGGNTCRAVVLIHADTCGRTGDGKAGFRWSADTLQTHTGTISLTLAAVVALSARLSTDLSAALIPGSNRNRNDRH